MKTGKWPFYIILLCLLSEYGFTQSDSVLATQRDIVDIYRSLTKKKPLAENNLRSNKVRFSGVPGVGYTLHTRWAATFAMNLAFFTDTMRPTNLSVINITPVYTENKQFIFSVQSNIWSSGNKHNFLGDMRYYKYPQNTFGLGGHTVANITNGMDYSYISVRQSALKSLANDFFVGVGYALDYHFNITETGNSDGTESDFHKYDPVTSSRSSGLTVHLLHDDRRNPINPKSGFYTAFTYRYNSTYLGSDHDWQSVIIDLRKYIKLPRRNKADNTLAFWSYSWFSFGGKTPYLDLPSTAWDTYSNIGRGYTQSRLRGANLLYLEGEYRFRILNNGLLGGVVFMNAQSVSDWPNNKFTTVWPGGGFGLRIKINKHSNTSIAIDYGFGLENSRGFFVNLGEVF